MEWVIAFPSYQIAEPLPLSNNSQALGRSKSLKKPTELRARFRLRGEMLSAASQPVGGSCCADESVSPLACFSHTGAREPVGQTAPGFATEILASLDGARGSPDWEKAPLRGQENRFQPS